MQVETPFNEAIIKKYPEQVVIVLAKEKSGRVNPISISWTMITSHVPPMMAISIGKNRFSLEVIREAGEFVIAYPSESQEKGVLLFGTKSGRDIDKLKLSNIAVAPAKQIDCLLLDDAVANFECSLIDEYTTGDHVIFVGDIKCAHVNPDSPERIYTVGKGYKMSGISIKKES